MKFFRSKREALVSDPSPSPSSAPIDRRNLVVGAGVAGAAAIAAAVLHRQAGAGAATELVAATPPATAEVGYQVTPHVLRYYETTRS